GTCKQYSKNAIPQETSTTIQRGDSLNFKCPYQAKVMKMFEAVRRRIVQSILLRERLLEVREQIFAALDAHGNSHEAIVDAELLPVLGRNRSVGHDRGVLDQAFHAAEGLGQGEDAGAFHHALCFLEATFH